MKYFNDLPNSLRAAKNKMIQNREERIMEDIKRLEQLKKVNPDKVSRYDFWRIFDHSPSMK